MHFYENIFPYTPPSHDDVPIHNQSEPVTPTYQTDTFLDYPTDIYPPDQVHNSPNIPHAPNHHANPPIAVPPHILDSSTLPAVQPPNLTAPEPDQVQPQPVIR